MADDNGFVRRVEPLTPVQRRLIQSASLDEAQELLFQHTVLCQTCLPYRNPGDEVRTWERVNGKIHLEINAGKAMHPVLERLVPVGLPFGPKPRLVLAHLNAEALRTGSPLIEVERSLSAFVRRLSLDLHGRNKRVVKDQLARLSASSIRLGMVREGRAYTVDAKIVTAFDIWAPLDQRQRTLWPSTVRLSEDYFQSLTNHAVPLDESAISALSHSAMALDIYAWLAQRLHRIEPEKPAFVSWMALKDQFGWHYERIRDFRRVFLSTLRQVHTQYPDARVEADERGMTLRHSFPPIKGRLGIVSRTPQEPGDR